MNTFGKHFRIHIFGESHGNGIGFVLDGCPAGLPINLDDFMTDLQRRQGGNQKGTTPRKENDMPRFLSGIFNDKTTGAPIAAIFENNNTRSGDYAAQRAIPRPGHADWVAHKKYDGNEDYRGGGHFSGRLTLPLVAAGVIAKKLLAKKGISIETKIQEIGGCSNLEEGLNKAIKAGDTIGGIILCTISGIPVGLGEPFFDSTESLISHAIFSIPAVKGIEFGSGFNAARMFGSDNNDPIIDTFGKTLTNNAGGIVGGITNGNDIIFRTAIKPTSSTPKQQKSLNWETGTIESFSIKGRHDLCIALRAPVVIEATTALVLADLMMIANQIPCNI